MREGMTEQVVCGHNAGEIEGRLGFFGPNFYDLESVARNIEATISRITGPEPSDACCGEPKECEPDGLLDRLSRITDKYAGITNHLSALAERLNKLI